MKAREYLRCIQSTFHGSIFPTQCHRLRRQSSRTATRTAKRYRSTFVTDIQGEASRSAISSQTSKCSSTGSSRMLDGSHRNFIHSTSPKQSTTTPASNCTGREDPKPTTNSDHCSNTDKVTSLNKSSYIDTGCMIYNSRSRTKTALTRRAHTSLSWYMCGPTVYDSMHLGHAVTYIRFDVIRRILTDYCGVPVFQVMGITDIDDKIIARAVERNVTVKELAETYEHEFLEDLNLLGCQPPTCTARVSDHLSEIISFIQGLEEKGFAYRLKDDEERESVYFDVGKFGDRYGALAPERTQINTAVTIESADEEFEPAKTNKRDVRDFALWKAADSTSTSATTDDVSWDSPWGYGRPGWHIECSAMSCQILGNHLDLHTGGIDLKFPHHENEIAQCEALHDHTWAHCFLHTGHLHIEGLKMSKSLKNFTTVRDFLGIPKGSEVKQSESGGVKDARGQKKVFTPQQLRLACLMTKYNAPMHYSDNLMTQALNIENRFRTFFSDVDDRLAEAPVTKWSTADTQLMRELESVRFKIDDRLRDDFDTPGAMHRLLDVVTTTNKHMSAGTTQAATASVVAVRDFINSTLCMMGVELQQSRTTIAGTGGSRVSSEEVLDHFIDFRSDVRGKALTAFKSMKKRNTSDDIATQETMSVLKEILTSCDGLRNEVMPSIGVSLKDSKDGSKWRFDQ